MKEFSIENYVDDFVHYKFIKLRDNDQIKAWYSCLIYKLLENNTIKKVEDPHILLWNNYLEI